MRARSTGGFPKGWINCSRHQKVKRFLSHVFPRLATYSVPRKCVALVLLVCISLSCPSVSVYCVFKLSVCRVSCTTVSISCATPAVSSIDLGDSSFIYACESTLHALQHVDRISKIIRYSGSTLHMFNPHIQFRPIININMPFYTGKTLYVTMRCTHR